MKKAIIIIVVVLCISGNVFAVLSGGGTQANPYLIQSRADFDEFSNPANAALYWANGKYTKLMCDIDLAGTTYTRAVIAPDTNIATAGFQGTQFNGVFDGNGHTISHLTITISTQDYIGLFGYVGLTGQVCDLSVENVNIVGREEVGCLIGNNEGSVFHCYSFGLVNGSEIVGGLVGSNSGSIISSYSTGSVSAAVYDAGGLVGWNWGTINSCYSSGQVIGSEGVGGLVSYNSASIINCYSTSLVNGTGSYMGGLVGYNNGGSVTISYSTGLVSGTGTYKGGLVGYNVIGDIASSFWDLDTSCHTISAGGEGKTTIEMQTLSTFTSAGWDFSATDGDPADWWMPQGDYPLLSWQGIPTTVNVPNVVGMAQADAETEITSAGLVVGTVATAYSSSVAAGNVISQSPTAGTSVNLNTTVNIQVSLGVGSSSPWQIVSNMMTARDQFAGCVIGDKIYVFGGNGNPDGFNLNSGEVYDIHSSSWSSIAANNYNYPYEGIEELTGVSLNGKFYVFGGWGGEGPYGYYGVFNFNEVYDPASNTWTTLAQKPTTTSATVAAVYNGKIYLFGGNYMDEGPGSVQVYYPAVEAYDPVSNTWQSEANMPKTLASPTVAVYNDSAYVIGGYDLNANAMNTEVMVYNFGSNTWTRNYCTAPADAARVYSYAAVTPVVDGMAYLIGGIEGDINTNWSSDKFTMFDIVAKTWGSGPALPEARSGHLVVVHNETPYVIGGYDDENNLNRAESTVYKLISPTSTGSILWQAVKAPYPNGIMYYAIQPRITISDMKACSLKGPNMADFIPAQWVADRGQWTLSIVPLTLSQLQQKSLGTWQLKLTDNDDRESIYSFTISGTLPDSEFLPAPVMIEPNYGDSNVIAEHYTLRWDPNGAQAGADALGVEITGNGFSYFSNTLDLSATSWDPGWLEIGSAYCKVGYADNRTDMINTPALVSGPVINWESTTASLVSGLYNSFTVKYSLDFNDDDSIDLADLNVFCSHWLEQISDGWTWVKGSDMPGQPGNYGSKGVISTSNTPGARELGVSWIDNNGKLWLFGGITGNAGFNDLWKFNGVNWVWLGGSDIPDQPGIYGVIGVAEPANVPGARFDSVSWVDNQGNFWLFGGVGYAAAGTSGFLNDLWKYNPTEGLWTWIKGADQLNQPGVYGAKSLPAIGNTPGARHGSIAWTDSSGNLWLFGGADSNNLFNDLWKFDGTDWTWISGSNLPNQPAIYGTKGIADPGNVPGAREGCVSWIDGSGNFWLFGGCYEDSISYDEFYYNDLWKFDGTDWTWVSGSDLPNQAGIYGTQGISGPENMPGAREGSVAWIDSEGNFWLFGGYYNDEVTETEVQYSDLWKFDGNNWTWIDGSDVPDQPGIYGIKGIAGADNIPGAREGSFSWIDSVDNVWLFGGQGVGAADSGYLNDLWKYGNDVHSVADFDDDDIVNFGDFAIFAQHWLEDVNEIANHVFGIDISTEWDYGTPNDSLDDEYGFDISFTTDDTVDRIEFTTPAGKTFEIPNTLPTEYPIAGGGFEGGREFDSESGRYEWCYYWSSNTPSLIDYGDGLYTVTIHFVGGRVQQTTAWFGIPGTSDPIAQPVQEPVFTSFNHGDTVSSPVTFAWQKCIDPAVEHIYLETDDNIPGSPMEIVLLASATGLDEPQDLTPGVWDDFELSFEVGYQSQNSDGIPVDAEKYSECDYVITVAEKTVAEHVDLVELCVGWDHADPDNTSDNTYDFELNIQTDDQIELIEFTTPAGNMFSIPSDSYVEESPESDGWLSIGRYPIGSGLYYWEYEYEFLDSNSLAAYGDGLYTIKFTFADGHSEQTTVWYSIPGTTEPIPQPTQMPQMTSFSNFDTILSPVTFTWHPCTDPIVQLIDLEYESDCFQDEYNLDNDVNGLSEPVTLPPCEYEIYLDFEVNYQTQNSDGVRVELQKYSESDYEITVVNNAADLNGDGEVDNVDLVVLANQWLQPPGSPSADIAPQPDGDGIVNLLDFSILADNWLTGI